MPTQIMKAPHILGAFEPNGRSSCDGDQPGTYTLQPGTSSSHDEEIYIQHNRVIWSIGRQVEKVVTLPLEVLQAVFCDFQQADGRALCVLVRGSIVVFGASGSQYSVHLPCEASDTKLWPLPHGVLISAHNGTSSDLLGLWHPLDEPQPVQSCDTTQLIDSDHKIIYSSTEHPFIVMYSKSARKHSLWAVRAKGINQSPMDDPTQLIAITLERLWEEPSAAAEASSIFVAADEADNPVLCLFSSEMAQLNTYYFRAARLEHAFNISARAAVPICALGKSLQILVLEGEGGLSVYVGQHRVWEYPPGLMTERIRASTGSTGTSIADTTLIALRDAVEDRVNLELANGSVLRVAWPLEFSSPLVCDCIAALDLVFPPAVLFAFRAAVLSSEANSVVDTDPEWAAFVVVLQHAVEGAVKGHVQSSSGSRFPSPSCQEPSKKSKSDGCKKLKCDDPNEVAHAANGDDAWLRLLQSDQHRKMKCKSFLSALSDPSEQLTVSVSQSHAAPVMPPLELEQLPRMLLALHMVYEDLKLSLNRAPLGTHLADLLLSLAQMVGADAYADQYMRDYPALCTHNRAPIGAIDALDPPNIRHWLQSRLSGDQTTEPYCPPALAHLSTPWSLSIKLTTLYQLIGNHTNAEQPVPEVPKQSCWDKLTADSPYNSFPLIVAAGAPEGSVVIFEVNLEQHQPVVMKAMLQLGVTMDVVVQMPPGIAVPLWGVLLHCRHNPELTWSPEAFRLIGRNDLAAQCEMKSDQTRVLFQPVPVLATDAWDPDDQPDEDGEEQIKDADGLMRFETYAALRFSGDRRAKEVRRMLCCSKLMCLRVPRAPETSDHDYLAQQHVALLLRAQRAMSLPVGRGMVTISSIYALPTERLRIPKLVLSGRVPPTNASISLDAANTPAELTNWPCFHNGVATGLQLVSADVACVTRNWIVYNRPETPSFEHAGLLMGLGLQGHLAVLAVTDIFRYLSYRHSATTVGVLLGMAAAKRGTMDPNVSKMLVMHIPYLLPPSLPEMEVYSVVQMAAVMGVGLLYQGTCHRLMTEVLLTEIGRRPMSDSTLEREGYSLAAGLALGLVNLGKGGKSFEDLHIEDKLQRYIDGGVDAMATNVQQPNNTARCCRIMESDMVNVDVTAPGATLALGLMYMKTNNGAVAARLAIPDSHFLLERVRPDFVLLRVLAHSLVMWASVEPTEEWLLSQVPVFLHRYHEDPQSSAEGLDHEALRQAHARILAGGCLALGLRFAGTSNPSAHALLLKHVRYFAGGCRSPCGEWTARDRPALETCLNTAALGLGMLMAGTGDLESLKLLRAQRRRIDPDISYGNHSAMQMAIGFLFLGAGRFSLSRSPAAIASLVIALYPRFTVSTTSNRYYLQACRHFYVMALEPRCLHAIDIDTNQPCSVPLELSVKTQADPINLSTPCLIPDSVGVQLIRLSSPVYFSRQVSVGDGQPVSQVIYVKRKTGCLTPALTAGPSALSTIDCSTIGAFTAPLTSTPDDTANGAIFCDTVPYCSTSNGQVQLLPVLMVLRELLDTLTKKQPIKPALCWDLRLLISYHNRGYPHPVALSSVVTVLARLDSFFDGLALEAEGGSLEQYLNYSKWPQNLPEATAFAGFLAYTGFPSLRSLQRARNELTKLFNGRAVQVVALMPILALLMPGCSSKALLKIATVWARSLK